MQFHPTHSLPPPSAATDDGPNDGRHPAGAGTQPRTLSLEEANVLETWCQDRLAYAADLWKRADDLERQAAWLDVAALDSERCNDPTADGAPEARMRSAREEFAGRQHRAAADLIAQATRIEQYVSQQLKAVQTARRASRASVVRS
jgi:hypothetical protein